MFFITLFTATKIFTIQNSSISWENNWEIILIMLKNNENIKHFDTFSTIWTFSQLFLPPTPILLLYYPWKQEYTCDHWTPTGVWIHTYRCPGITGIFLLLWIHTNSCSTITVEQCSLHLSRCEFMKERLYLWSLDIMYSIIWIIHKIKLLRRIGLPPHI